MGCERSDPDVYNAPAHMTKRFFPAYADRAGQRCCRALIPALVMLITAAMAAAQGKPAPKWVQLLRAGKIRQARTLCQAGLELPDVRREVEAEKCLANVEIAGKSIVCLEGNDQGGGMIDSCYPINAANLAVQHLDVAIKLAPQDLTVHEGRLHLLEVSQQYDAMAKALDESCTLYSGPHALGAWLNYPNELYSAGQYRLSLLLLRVLQRHYPMSHRVQGNMGGAYFQLHQDQKALVHLRKAVELAPKDPIDNWDLALTYADSGDTKVAASLFPKALALSQGKPSYAEQACLYAHFLDQQLHQTSRACPMEKQYCEANDQSACGGGHQPNSPETPGGADKSIPSRPHP